MSRLILLAVIIVMLVGCGDEPAGPEPMDHDDPIEDTNRPPNIAPPPTRAGVVGDTVGFPLDVSDPDEDDFVLQLISALSLSEFRDGYLPDAEIEPTTGLFLFTLGLRDVPARKFTIVAIDTHGAEASISFSVTVDRIESAVGSPEVTSPLLQ